MKPGDLILHRGPYDTTMGILLYNNEAGGTLKIYDVDRGKSVWKVKSECKVISECEAISESR
jgi:hypothetical protein